MARAESLFSFPPGAISCVIQFAPKRKSACVMPAHKRVIRHSQRSSDWLYDACRICPQYQDRDALITRLRREHPDWDITKLYDQAKMILNLPSSCGGAYKYIGETCPAGLAILDTKETKVDVPTTLWVKDRSDFEVYAVREYETSLVCKPFQLANIYPSGLICWGRNKKPATLRDAYEIYWQSVFNQDMTVDYQHSLSHTLQKYHPEMPGTSDWRNLFGSVFGQDYEARESGYLSALVITDAANLNLIPRKYRSETRAVGWARYSTLEQQYYLNFNGFLARKKTMSLRSKMTPIGPVDRLL